MARERREALQALVAELTTVDYDKLVERSTEDNTKMTRMIDRRSPTVLFKSPPQYREDEPEKTTFMYNTPWTFTAAVDGYSFITVFALTPDGFFRETFGGYTSVLVAKLDRPVQTLFSNMRDLVYMQGTDNDSAICVLSKEPPIHAVCGPDVGWRSFVPENATRQIGAMIGKLERAGVDRDQAAALALQRVVSTPLPERGGDERTGIERALDKRYKTDPLKATMSFKHARQFVFRNQAFLISVPQREFYFDKDADAYDAICDDAGEW